MIRPARSRRSTAKATFRRSSRVYFRPRRRFVTARQVSSASAEAALIGLVAHDPTITISTPSDFAAIAMSAQDATVKISVNPATAEIVFANTDVVPRVPIACAWFTTTVTVDQHFCTVDLDFHEGSITLDAHTGVVGVEAHYGEVVVCGRE